MNCAKHAQWNLQLHHLGVMLGYKVSNFMHDPLVNICTRPVVYFNNIDTSKNMLTIPFKHKTQNQCKDRLTPLYGPARSSYRLNPVLEVVRGLTCWEM